MENKNIENIFEIKSSETPLTNIERINSAGSNFKKIASAMIAAIITSIIQLLITYNLDMNSRHAMETAKTTSVICTFFYVIFAIAIIVFLYDAGGDLCSCKEKEEKKDSATAIANKVNSILSYLNANEKHTGEMKEGGIIVCKDIKEEIGLICSDVDLGKTNWSEAERICKEYRGGGFSNWRLPDKDELFLIYSMLHTKKGIKGFSPDNYWSSSQDYINYGAFIQSFTNGLQYNTNKDYVNNKEYSFCVRAVRYTTPPPPPANNNWKGGLLGMLIVLTLFFLVIQIMKSNDYYFENEIYAVFVLLLFLGFICGYQVYKKIYKKKTDS